MNFFCPPETVTPCGIYTPGHFAFLAVAITGITLALLASRRWGEREILRATRIITAVLWVLEIAKIVFNLTVVRGNFNDYIPLYFCSLILYAGALSSVGRGVWRRIGDVFISTGAIVGGVAYLIYPSTSLPRYPFFHFLSFHSILLHSCMIFLGILYLRSGYCRPRPREWWKYGSLVMLICVISTVFNQITGANLMFVSHDFPGTPVHWAYVLFPGFGFTVFMSLLQAIGPFWFILGWFRLFLRLWRRHPDSAALIDDTAAADAR